MPVVLGMILKILLPNFTARFEKFFINLSFILFLVFLFMAIYQEYDNLLGYFSASGMVTFVLNIN